MPVGSAGYAGLAALAGTVLAIGLGIRRCLPLLGTAAVVGALIAELRPLIDIVHRLPLVETVEWTRLMSMLPLCLAISGAVGLSELMRRRRPASIALIAAAAAISLTVSSSTFIAGVWLAIGVSVVGALIRPKLGMAMLVVVALVDLGPWARAMLPAGDPQLFYPRTPFMTVLQGEHAAAGSPRGVGLGYNVYPSMLAIYGVADIRYHNPVADHRYAQVLDAALDFHPVARPYEYFSPVRSLPPLVDFLNLGFVITGSSDLPDRFVEVGTDAAGRRRLFENRRRLPRAFIPTVGVVVDAGRTLDATASITDPRTVVVSRAEAAGRQVPPSRWDPDAVVWTDEGDGRVALDVRGQGARLVATSLTHPVGWTARSDDRRLEIVTVNHAFVGIVAPDGVGHIELTYAPPGFRTGIAIGLLGLVVFAALVAAAVRSRTQRPSH